jgi:deoxyribodipyrimidine photo-lyase
MRDPVVFWFRRDLRLADHPALVEAAAAGPVVPVFVLDPVLQRPSGANRLAFLAGSLGALDQSLGGRLVVRSGRPEDVLLAVAQEAGAGAVFATDDFGPYGRQRDQRVGSVLSAAGIAVHFRHSAYAVAPGTVRTGDGRGYRVFSPFRRAWEATGWPQPIPAVTGPWWDGELASEGPPSSPAVDAQLPVPGEEAGWERAEAFLAGPVEAYHDQRNQPGIDGTSRLSPYLKWGALHPRQLLARLGPGRGPATFRSELAWREFYADVLFSRPDSARQTLDQRMAGLRRDSGRTADARFRAWTEGRTGFPLVDAGMRQLVGEGWVHNRVRLVVASFLVKDLHLDWRRGARFFMDHLVDGDVASNQHGWQWVAGTGTDSAPFVRIFNPVTQSQRFDPDGSYLRRWLPELRELADDHLHAPWTAPGGPPSGYPAPIVDHAEQRREALARYEALGAGGTHSTAGR